MMVMSVDGIIVYQSALEERHHQRQLNRGPQGDLPGKQPRSMASFATADIEGLVRIIKRKLRKIQYRLHLINGASQQPT